MKKYLSFLMALVLMLMCLPVSAISFWANTKSEYFLDFDAENGYVGNYALLSDGDYSATNYAQTGDLTGLIDTVSEEEEPVTAAVMPELAYSDDGVVSFKLPTDLAEAFVAENNEMVTKATYTVGSTFQWFHLGDAYEMYSPYVTVTGSSYTCRAVGSHCYIWASTQVDGASIRIPEAEAEKLAAEYDRLYATTVNAFGSFGSSGEKMNILVHNLSGTLDSYFYYYELASLGNNAGQFFFHVDNYPTMTVGDGAWNVENAYEAMSSAFAETLVYLRTENRTPAWLTQTIGEAAIAMNYGETATQQRIRNWETAIKPYANGKSVYNWLPQSLDDDATYLYMFAQYVSVQSDGYGVFGSILDYYAAGSDRVGESAIPAALTDSNLNGMTLAEILDAYRIALLIQDIEPGSIYGFNNIEVYKYLPRVYYTDVENMSPKVYGGGSIVVKTLDEHGKFVPPEDIGTKISLVGITVSVDELPTLNIVRFVDWDETLLKEELVFAGFPATAPADPYRSGYTFTGWDKDFSNVTESMTVTALYSEGETYYTVSFINDNGETMFTQQVIKGFKAEAPERPTRSGDTFTTWFDEDGNVFNFNTAIYADTNLYAQWILTRTIYAFTYQQYRWGSVSTDALAEFNELYAFNSTTGAIAASTYYDGTVYAFNTKGEFITINSETFEPNLVREENASIYLALAMTYDYSADAAYLSYIDTSYICHLSRVNLETGAVTSIATASVWYMALACSKDGTLYGVTSTGAFVRINKTNARFTDIGDTGFDIGSSGEIYRNVLMFDYSTGELFWSAKSMGTEEGFLFLVNTDDGSVISLGATLNNDVYFGMFIPYTYTSETYYEVTFVDWDGTVLKTESVLEGTDATAPENPTRLGYEFTGWSDEFTNVQDNLRVYAQYSELPKYTVMFLDWDNSVLSTQSVYKGYDAVPPQSPEREGYTFTGWDKEYTNIQSDIVIIAQYTSDEIIPGDLTGDGRVNTGDAVMLLRYAAGMLTLTPEQLLAADMNGDTRVNTGDAVAILKHVAGITA